MLLVVACGALAIATLLYVFWITPEPVRRKSAAEAERDFLAERKEVVYENLRDLQLEYHMGKLSDEDYQHLKLTYQQQLAELLDAAAHLEQPPAKATPAPGRCAHCGQNNPPQNRFCGACGASLPAEATA